MEFKLFGFELRLEVIIICVLVGMVLGGHLLCSCSKLSLQEGMEVLGAPLDYKIRGNVYNSWMNKTDNYSDEMGYQVITAKQDSNYVDPVEKGSMLIFQNNQSSGDCCPSSYSNSMGCICETSEQVAFLNERGGNRTMAPAEF